MARVFQTIFALSLFLYLSCFINGVVARTTLHQNDYLLQNDSLKNGNTMLLMHSSCNLILYDGPKQIWDTDTAGKASHSCWAQLLLNGNFVVFGDNKILWSSDSSGVVGKYTLSLEDNKNFAIFSTCTPLWSPKIGIRGVQVIDGEPIWSAGNIIKKKFEN